MAIVVPTITAENTHTYREQMERIEPFASRIHIDIMDGTFTPNKSVSVNSLWWPEATEIDIHVMFQHPQKVLQQLAELRPSLVIVPAESDKGLHTIVNDLEQHAIRAGVALLPETPVSAVKTLLPKLQHVLIFSGNLGHQGDSHADLTLLAKVQEIKAINPVIEIGWDGGVNDQNVKQLTEAGIDVVNAGGFIHFAKGPETAYRSLNALIS